MHYTFINQVIEERDSQFNNSHKAIIAAQKLVPTPLVQFDDAAVK